MSWTITQRLTFTFAFVTGLVLGLAGLVAFLVMRSRIREDGLAVAHENALHHGHRLMDSLDDEILVEFRGGIVAFDKLDAPQDNCAVVRGDGRIERVEGAWRGNEEVLRSVKPGADAVVSLDGTSYSVASRPLVEVAGLGFEDLPPVVQKAALEKVPGSLPMSVKSELVQDQNVIAIKLLRSDDIVELLLTEGGRVVQERREALPVSLPEHFLAAYSVDPEPGASRLVSWTARGGQLIAVCSEIDEQGRPRLVGWNRLGEGWSMSDEGSPTEIRERTRLFIVAAVDASRGREKTAMAFRVLLFGGGLTWLMVVLIGWGVTRRALAPVDRIVETLQSFRLSSPGRRLPVDRVNDELSRISATINDMLERVEQAYETERQFTADASHELRGPLARLIADVEVALDVDRDGSEYREFLVHAKGYALEMQRLVESLLLLARLDAREGDLPLREADLVQIAVDTIRSLPQEDASRVELKVEDATLDVLCEPTLIGTMVHNLLENGLRYSPRDKPVYLRLSSAGDLAVVEVEDGGAGIPDSESERVFDRFYRLDKARSSDDGGLGLGLAIVKAIADVHCSSIRIAPGEQGGTRIVFTLRSVGPRKDDTA